MLPAEIIRRIRHIEISSNRAVSDIFAGQYQSVFKGSGIEFQEVRHYCPGDDVRTIDWNVTARMGYPYIKKYTEERERTVMLLVDISASQEFGTLGRRKKDLLAELSAVLSFSAIRNNDRVGLLLFTRDVERFVPPRKGRRHVLRIIREVLQFKPSEKGTRLLPALDFLNHVARRRTVTFLMSDFLDAGYEKALAATSERHDVIGVLVQDRRERAWPGVGIVSWRCAESGRRRFVDTSDRRTVRAFARERGLFRERLVNTFRSCGVDMVEVTAGMPYERELIAFFRKRERRLH